MKFSSFNSQNQYFKAISIAILALVLLFTISIRVYADELTGTNYKIEGATLSGGSIGSSANYSLINTMGELSGNPYVNSSLYRLKTGSLETFIANVPKISCFETQSNGSSNCTTGPSYLNSGGVVRICGAPGCYNRARLEIDVQNNPSDTLYGIQISDDNFVSDVRAIDGATKRPKAYSARTLADYLTKTAWESASLNIQGLEPNKQYWVKITALHGDFTESQASPVVTATTALPSVDFDLDIASESGVSAESAPPYNIFFTSGTKLYRGGSPQTATNLIWIDVDTNASDGMVIAQNGYYGGLYSTNQTYLIDSAIADLSTASEGFGLQNYDYSGTNSYCSYYTGSGLGELSTISVDADYVATSINAVGNVDTNFLKVYSSDGPIASGRMALRVKAKASESAPADTDYTETITFVVIARY